LDERKADERKYDWWNVWFHIRGVSEKSRQLVEAIRRKRQPLFPIPQTPSASHRYERQISFRRRGVQSTIQIVWPSASMAGTQPKLQPALLSLSAMISQYFIGSLRFS
jgi:hypothetical protein